MPRNAVESGVKALLIAAASIAILTTIGIVLSLIFNTITFFGMFPASDFLFGLTWSPEGRGGSEHLGILPLLWGTIYISIVALLVAVPIGLFAAVYLSEYASRTTRAIAKPLLEVLAGIPTIVYGLFAPDRCRPASGEFLRCRWTGLDAGRTLGHDRRSGDGHHADPPSCPRCPMTSLTRCRRRCATDPTVWARRNRKRYGRWCCQLRYRALWGRSCWRPRAPSARQ